MIFLEHVCRKGYFFVAPEVTRVVTRPATLAAYVAVMLGSQPEQRHARQAEESVQRVSFLRVFPGDFRQGY